MMMQAYLTCEMSKELLESQDLYINFPVLAKDNQLHLPSQCFLDTSYDLNSSLRNKIFAVFSK